MKHLEAKTQGNPNKMQKNIPHLELGPKCDNGSQS